MACENGTWIMRGLDWDDPGRIPTWQQLGDYVDQVGFLPLFKNQAPGFSVEEHVSPLFWWTGDPEQDPWAWRELLAGSGRVAYGKFFGKKAGFISRTWFPCFANWRRAGYDFDSRWDDELASARSKKVMDCFVGREEWFSFALKRQAGFGKGGEKNFEGVVTQLQMESYLLIRDFRRRLNKGGLPYGWPIAVYSTPEALWGGDHISSGYCQPPEDSGQQVLEQLCRAFLQAEEAQLREALG